MLKSITDVAFLILREDASSLLSMTDMETNHLYISIKHKHISFAWHKHPLAMENYFLIHRWNSQDIPYALHTELALPTIHWSFVHPSIRSTEGLLRGSPGGSVSKEVRETIK